MIVLQSAKKVFDIVQHIFVIETLSNLKKYLFYNI